MRLATCSLLLVLLAPLAAAHATPDETTPRAGSVVGPDARLVRVDFSEPLIDGLSCIETRRAGALLARTCTLPPGELRALQLVAPGVPSGVVDVRWRVLGLDGHVREGGYSYAVAAAAPSAAVELDTSPPWSRLLGGALALASAAAVGVPTFARRSDARARAARVGAGAALAAAGIAAILLVATATSLDARVGALAATFPGSVLAIEAALFALAAAFLLAGRVERGAFAAGAGLALGLLTAHAIVGGGGPYHAAHVGLVFIVAHVGAAAVWSGAVGGLLMAPAEAPRARKWARGAVLVLALSGVGLAMLTSLDARVLLRGAFGALFIAKLALFAGALLLGLLHERRYRRQSAPSRAAVAIEALLLTAALVTGGALAATPV